MNSEPLHRVLVAQNAHGTNVLLYQEPKEKFRTHSRAGTLSKIEHTCMFQQEVGVRGVGRLLTFVHAHTWSTMYQRCPTRLPSSSITTRAIRSYPGSSPKMSRNASIDFRCNSIVFDWERGADGAGGSSRGTPGERIQLKARVSWDGGEYSYVVRFTAHHPTNFERTVPNLTHPERKPAFGARSPHVIMIVLHKIKKLASSCSCEGGIKG